MRFIWTTKIFDEQVKKSLQIFLFLKLELEFNQLFLVIEQFIPSFFRVTLFFIIIVFLVITIALSESFIFR
jgi:hypothetical protein